MNGSSAFAIRTSWLAWGARTSVLAPDVRGGVDALKELPIAYLRRPVGCDTLPGWVFDLASHAEYREKWGAAHWDALRPGDAMSGQFNYGRYA